MRLTCSGCSEIYPTNALINVCRQCGSPVLALYDLSPRPELRQEIRTRVANMWRYREVLPPVDDADIITLGEGITPLLPSHTMANVWIKDESKNPTRSFKSRGMAAAVTMAKKLGAKSLGAPTAGNAGAALSAYGARAGLPVFVAMPRDTPQSIIDECRSYGAQIELVAGVITDAAKRVAQYLSETGGFDLSTLKEPYRVEGKKIMGYELLDDLGRLPDVILYPTGGGTGLIGMWKAFDEMESLGWIGSERPRMFTVQASGCAPIVRAFEAGEKFAAEFPDAHTLASGLRVPKAVGDFIMLDILRKSGGGAVTVEDEEMIDATWEVGAAEGLFVAPEGAACFVALKKLLADGKIAEEERVVIFNTGSGIKYLDCYQT